MSREEEEEERKSKCVLTMAKIQNPPKILIHLYFAYSRMIFKNSIFKRDTKAKLVSKFDLHCSFGYFIFHILFGYLNLDLETNFYVDIMV